MSSLTSSVKAFAVKSEQRVAMHGCMQEWASLVLMRLEHIIRNIPDDACLSSLIPLSYTQSDENTMRDFLSDKVCTSTNNAASTLMFDCQQDYVDRVLMDLSANAVYVPVSRTVAAIVQDSNEFVARYGFAPSMRCQEIPHIKAIDKMHKTPDPGCRFISSSALSHLRHVSIFLNFLFNALSLDIDQLFGGALSSMGITASWTARSWVLRNIAQLVPLLRVWNTHTAQHTHTAPHMDSRDFARLYTNIDTNDMRQQVMGLISQIFALPRHAAHVGIKVWETKPAVWLQPHQMLANDHDCSGTGHGGKFMIFSLQTIEIWLSFLLANMYVRFGDQIHRQIQGTPMGTNCASHLANLYLTMYELQFIMRLRDLYLDACFVFLRTIVYQIACAFLFTARYIDDLLSISNPYLCRLLYVDQSHHHPRIKGIYPRTLLVTSADTGTSVNYMDVTVMPERGSRSRLTTVLFDKREHSPLSDCFIIKFPHASSNISSTAKYGIITSQFHRLRRIIMLRPDFNSRMAGIVSYMQLKGHDVPRMMQQVKSLCNRHLEMYGTHCRALYQQIQAALAGIQLNNR